METSEAIRQQHDGWETEIGRAEYPSRGPIAGQGTVAVVYLLGMILVILSGSAFVVGGMLVGARGLSAVVVAAAVPSAGLLFAVTLSALHRERRGR